MLLIAAIGVFSLAFSALTDKSACVFYNLTGIPCPSCGMTRAYMSFFGGRFREAFSYHPLFWTVPLIPLCLIETKRFSLSKKTVNAIFISMAVLFIAVWAARLIFASISV